ncbi:MAG TPA: potassium/proton antiporter [Clostridia bacterium]|jgi:cell volume regulation protein A|nr:potassium/proton antiporter [Clostridia bacterium]
MQYLLIGVILILALMAIRLSNRHGIPALLLFIVLGMGFGALGLKFDDYELADGVATVALMVIMFYGGFGTNWKMARPVAREAIVLSFLGTVTTGLITGLFCHWVLGFSLLEGMLLGSIVGSTDYASVSNILRSKNLNLKYNTAPLLELESGSNDPTAYTMTMVFLSVIQGTKLSIPVMVVSQVAVGLAVGFALSFLFGLYLKKVRTREDGLSSVLMAAMMLITYSVTNLLSGNGYLALYILGIYLGNMEFRGKRDVIFFFDGLTEIMQIALFFVLGLLSNLNGFIAALPVALAIMAFMTVVSRPLSVWGLMLPFRLKRNQLHMISLAGIRGAAAIAFAILVVNKRAPISADVYHIVFGICVFSSLVQGSLMPPAARRLDMLDPNDTVLKTFNDYQDKAEIGFLQTRIHKDSYLVGRQVKDLRLTFDFIVARIDRGGRAVVPRGNVELQEDDLIVLAGEKYFDRDRRDLTEFTIPERHDWAGKSIRELNLPEDTLIVMVQRSGSDVIVPLGDVVLQENDKVILLHVREEDGQPAGKKSLLSRLRLRR